MMFLSPLEQSSQMVGRSAPVRGLAFAEVTYFFYNHTAKLFLLGNNHLFVTSMCGCKLSPWGRIALSLLPCARSISFLDCLGSQVSTGSAAAYLWKPQGSTLHNKATTQLRCQFIQNSIY